MIYRGIKVYIYKYPRSMAWSAKVGNVEIGNILDDKGNEDLLMKNAKLTINKFIKRRSHD